MDKFRSQKQKRISSRQEKRAAQDLGGRTVAGSGAAKFSGGADVRKQGDVRCECKYTSKDYYDLKLSDMKKLQKQALQGGLEQPVMQVEFTGRLSWVFAIYPDLSNEELAQYATSAKKQLRLHRDQIQGLLVSHEGVQVTFLEGPRSRPHTFTITHWSSFLARLEKEDEC